MKIDITKAAELSEERDARILEALEEFTEQNDNIDINDYIEKFDANCTDAETGEFKPDALKDYLTWVIKDILESIHEELGDNIIWKDDITEDFEREANIQSCYK